MAAKFSSEGAENAQLKEELELSRRTIDQLIKENESLREKNQVLIAQLFRLRNISFSMNSPDSGRNVAVIDAITGRVVQTS